MNKKKVLIIAVCVILLILIVVISFMIKKSHEDTTKKYPKWTEEVDRVDYMRINDYLSNSCNYKYYTPNFKIKDDILYDSEDNLIKENVYTISFLSYGDCKISMIFVTTINGRVYYINNLVDSKYKKYESVEINNVYNIVNVVSDQENVTAIDSVDTEYEINDYIKKILEN